ATHNAYTIAAIKKLAAGREFEFQRLHGMGEQVYETLAEEEGERPTRVRIYAPVGGHKDLLAYLVRRLLENGANSSFVNRMADANVPVAELTTDPVAELSALQPRRNPAIPLPADIYPNRRNSAGIDLADPLVRQPLLDALEGLAERQWEAAPTARAPVSTDPAEAEPADPFAEQPELVESSPIRSPQDNGVIVGHAHYATPADIALMLERTQAAQSGWDALGGAARAELLERASDLFEIHAGEIISLCVREAGKTLPDAV